SMAPQGLDHCYVAGGIPGLYLVVAPEVRSGANPGMSSNTRSHRGPNVHRPGTTCASIARENTLVLSIRFTAVI
ncbi:MAG: hypothetical protein ABI912_02985, partial [Actinomycetota bacterium]